MILYLGQLKDNLHLMALLLQTQFATNYLNSLFPLLLVKSFRNLSRGGLNHSNHPRNQPKKLLGLIPVHTRSWYPMRLIGHQVGIMLGHVVEFLQSLLQQQVQRLNHFHLYQIMYNLRLRD